jgi:hypothetical protein
MEISGGSKKYFDNELQVGFKHRDNIQKNIDIVESLINESIQLSRLF